MTPNQSVELRGQSYYLAGTRISLDSVAYALRRGETVDDILADFPALSSRETLKGSIAFIESNQAEIDSYLANNEKRWKEKCKLNSPELIERARMYRAARELKTA